MRLVCHATSVEYALGLGAVSLSWSADSGKLAVGDDYGSVLVWDTGEVEDQGDECTNATHFDAYVERTSKSAEDGTEVADVLETYGATSNCRASCGVHGDPGGAGPRVAWAPTGSQLATAAANSREAGENTIRVWEGGADLEAGSLSTRTGRTGYATAIAWSPDGARIVTASADNSLRVWSSEWLQLSQNSACEAADAIGPVTLVSGPVPRGDALRTRSVAWLGDGTGIFSDDDDPHAVWDVAWAPDSQRLVSSSADGSLTVRWLMLRKSYARR